MDPVTTSAITTTAVASAAHTDLSLISLFLHADFVVKLVMIGLIIASFWCWTIIFEKLSLLKKYKSLTTSFEERFWQGGSLEELYDSLMHQPAHPMSTLFTAAMREWRKSPNKTGAYVSNLLQRIERAMNLTTEKELARVEKNISFLAMLGSAAPFIGLFGTVWGIMNSFTAIAGAENTSLAIVAPGIAEALFATAIGLFAAIPAYIAYNKLSHETNQFASKLYGFTDEFITLVSRQLDSKGQ